MCEFLFRRLILVLIAQWNRNSKFFSTKSVEVDLAEGVWRQPYYVRTKRSAIRRFNLAKTEDLITTRISCVRLS